MKIIKFIILSFLIIFGLLNIFTTSSIILDLFNIREHVGNFVPFIIWINLFFGIIYLVSAYGFWKLKDWTIKLLSVNTFILVIGLILLSFYINLGGIYKTDTIFALIFRIIVTIITILTVKYVIKSSRYKYN